LWEESLGKQPLRRRKGGWNTNIKTELRVMAYEIRGSYIRHIMAGFGIYGCDLC
jgi:hypothetical protein